MIPGWRRSWAAKIGWGPRVRNPAALVSPDLIDNVGMITETYDRSRALQELAREAILSNQLLLAHRTLLQASKAALEEPNALRHDQLIIEIITTTGQLTETLIREGRTQLTMLEPQEGRPEPLPQKLTPKLLDPVGSPGMAACHGPGSQCHQSHLS